MEPAVYPVFPCKPSKESVSGAQSAEGVAQEEALEIKCRSNKETLNEEDNCSKEECASEKKKIRRGMRCRNALKKCRILADNVRGVKSKINSLQDIVTEQNPTFICLSETKLNEGDIVDMEGYVIKRRDRLGEGGGVLIGYKEGIANIVNVVREEHEKLEMLWVKLDNNVVKVRIGVVYMPQENLKTVKELGEIYRLIEEEIETAIAQKEKIFLVGDFNCRVGTAINGNEEKVTKGGRILLKMMKKYNLCLMNNADCCIGKWTRIEGDSKSIIDYAMVLEEDVERFKEMTIDEGKEFTPYNVEITDEGKRIVYTDHCMMRLEAGWYIGKGEMGKTTKILDSKRILEFGRELEEEKVSEIINEESIKASYTQWSDKVMRIHDKYTITRKPRKKRGKCCRLLLRNKRAVTKELKKTILDKSKVTLLKKRKQLIMEHLDDERTKENKMKVDAVVREVKEAGGVDSGTFWEVKNKLVKNTTNEIAAIMDEEGVRQEEENAVKKVHCDYFKKLLQTKPAETEEERRREEEIETVIRSMELLSKMEEPKTTTREELDEVIRKLNIKKAKDRDGWSNAIVVKGGEEMALSLLKIINAVDKKMILPDEWSKMKIRVTDKKGSKLLMKNKRGLFLTNIISKIYERVVKNRNEEESKQKRSPWQMAQKRRSTTDNLFIVHSIIERNRYLKKSTYLFYADAEKCFDKLWLFDSIVELWMQGTNVRDAIMIKKMNEVARIIIQTPVGETEEIVANNIVRQGTVYGPPMCGVSMSRVNDVGRKAVTFYGPKLVLQPTQYVDDITGAGSARATNNNIYNCSRLEDTKKMSFNNGNGKTEYSIVKPKVSNTAITEKINKGLIKRTEEHKALGMWIDESGQYGVNIVKNNTRLSHMIEIVKAIGSSWNVGTLAIATRIKLVSSVILQSILDNIQVIPQLTNNEMKDLENMQKKILARMLEVPMSAPYMGLLMETGSWTMQARIEYKKLMLYHNIKHSEEDRVIKQIVRVQEEEERPGTWNEEVKLIIKKYGIEKDVEKVMKSEWKNEAKKKIGKNVEEEIRKCCKEMSKTRTIMDDEYKMKTYFDETTVSEATDILRTRLHITKITCNYGKNDNCPLCGHVGHIRTEHYFECAMVKPIADIWQTSKEDLNGSLENMVRAKNHLKKVEVLMEPYMKHE